MMIALPNADFTFTCTLFCPFEGENSFAALDDPARIRAFFEREFGDAPPLMPSLVEEFQANPVGSLITVRCFPWHTRDRAVLIGDACHAVVPFYGQGMNAAFEDCTVLSECLAAAAPDVERALGDYERRRKRHADALADLALANFVEMRDHVGSARFLWRKRVERILDRLLGSWYVPLYTMVSFTRIPYGDARERARHQDRVVLAVALIVAALAVILILSVLF